MLKDSTDGGMVDSNDVNSQNNYCLSHRNSFFYCFAQKKKMEKLIFPMAAHCDPSVAEEESTKRQFSIALKAAHCSQGRCLLSVSSGAWQWWLCVYISVRCDGASWLK